MFPFHSAHKAAEKFLPWRSQEGMGGHVRGIWGVSGVSGDLEKCQENDFQNI